MQDLTSALFKPYTLVIIRLNDGSTIQGTVLQTDDGSVQMKKKDGEIVDVTSSLLTEAVYCYTGFPTIQEKTVHKMVEGNGKVTEYLDGKGFVAYNENAKILYRLVEVSLVDPELQQQVNEGGIDGEAVLYVIPDKQKEMPLRAAILKAGTLDSILDKIAMLASQRQVSLANKFCELVLKQYPQDEDVIAFSKTLEASVEKSRPVDFYSAVPESPEGELNPFGRIYEVDGEYSGLIVEPFSHAKIQFRRDQLFGGLESRRPESLVGQPVLYSVKKSKKGVYYAKSVMPPLTPDEAYSLAKRLHIIGQKLSACDVLSLVLDQEDDPRCRRDYAIWSNDYFVRDQLWDNEYFEKYKGEPEQLFLPYTKKEESLILKRTITHAETRSELSKTPDVPSIMSAQELDEMLASIPSASDLPGVAEEQLKTRIMEASQVLEKEQPSQIPTLNDCPDANVKLEAKATIMVAWREGTLFVKGEERPFKFSVEDIIDDELYNRADMYSTKFIQDEPVVCKLSYIEHRATQICPPRTVLEMLESSRNAIIEARSCNQALERERIYRLYDCASGYAGHVLDMIPNHRLAITLKSIADDAINKFKDTCYIAPFNAIKPCGHIVSMPTKKSPLIRVKDPLFHVPIELSLDNIVDRDYKKYRKGDELVYSVYPGKNNNPIIRFACLARPVVDLIDMAENWEKEGNYENAWGTAMIVLDADGSNSDALAIVERCEPYVSDNTIDKRQLVLRENIFAQAQKAALDEDYDKAIALFSKIVESTDDNQNIKKMSVLRILYLYSLQLSEKHNDKGLAEKYRKAGEQYILGKHDTPFHIACTTKDEIESVIQFYQDMGDVVGLIDSYKKKLEILNKESDDSDEHIQEVASVYAHISWYQLLANDSTDEPRINAEHAKKEGDDLGRICETIFKLRQGDVEKTVREQGKFSSQDLAAVTEGLAGTYAEKVYKKGGPKNSLTYERFALLCAIIKGEKKASGQKKLLHYLGRYIATLTGNEADYVSYVESTKNIPDDCNLVRELYKCFKNGPAGRSWMDVRLICMLSEEAAYKICSAMYCLDRSMAANVLIRSEVDIYESPSESVFARSFAQWRGVSILPKYNECFNRVAAFEKSTDLNKCVEFFRDLKFESWMVSDDQELIHEFHWQIPDMLMSLITAESSRAIKVSSRLILDSISEWNDVIKDRPTVLMLGAYYHLLMLIRQEVTRIESSYHFSEPDPKARVLSFSVPDANGTVYMEMEVRNKDVNAEPMQDCKLHLLPTDGIIPDTVSPVETYSDEGRVYGDESVIYILCFRVKHDMDLTELKVSVHFEYRVKAVPKGTDFVLKFKPLKKWTDIENFFNPGAPEYNHFYGRQAYIKKVVSVFSDPKNSPHFFIYGQKRSGKTSVLAQIKKQHEERVPSAIIVKADFLGLDPRSDNDIYHLILKRILQAIGTLNRKAKITGKRDFLDSELLEIPPKEDMDYDLLRSRLEDLTEAMSETRGWKDSRLILFIDEFTTAYEWFLSGRISIEFMPKWKSLQADGFFGAVLVGQDVLHQFMNAIDGPNAFEILDKERLNYLEPEDAKRLITETIENLSQRKDVFVGNAIERILYYTASSAFYTKWVCNRLIDYMNARRLNKATEADVDAVVWRAMRTIQPTELRAKFDPLIFPGIKSEKEYRFNRKQTMNVLDIVADEELRNPVRGCRKMDLMARSGEPNDDIIKDLVERGVLDDNHDYYKIKLKLYIVWYQERNTSKAF